MSDHTDHIHSATILGRCVVHTLDAYRVGGLAWAQDGAQWLCRTLGAALSCVPVLTWLLACANVVARGRALSWAGSGAHPAAGLLQPLPLLRAHQGGQPGRVWCGLVPATDGHASLPVACITGPAMQTAAGLLMSLKLFAASPLRCSGLARTRSRSTASVSYLRTQTPPCEHSWVLARAAWHMGRHALPYAALCSLPCHHLLHCSSGLADRCAALLCACVAAMQVPVRRLLRVAAPGVSGRAPLPPRETS